MIHKMEFIVFSIIFLLSSCSAQVLQEGQCDPNLPLQQDFDAEQFAGTWYEISKSADILPIGDCGSIEITNNNSTVFGFTNEVVRQNFADSASGNATYQNGTARFSLNLNVSSSAIDFWIVATNYVGYSVAYKCENFSATYRSVSVWALARVRNPTNLTSILISNVIENNLGISYDELTPTSHTDYACHVLPVIPFGQPVVLPGLCNSTTIPVVQNFNATGFLGTWHEISSYYSESSSEGNCSRAEYSDGGDRVLVVNSQVVNETLQAFEGYAVVNSTDGSARLAVTLEILPGVFVDQELLVVATDYTSYAITYSCTDLPNDQRRVYSWLASRTRYITPSAQAAVDQVVDSTLDLNYAYYRSTVLTDESCFYYPEPSPNSTVVFRGLCNESIPAVPNFDAVAYMGLWHDIESYPTGFQQGQCNNAFYTLLDGFVDVFNTEVINQTLDTIRGTAVPVADDGSGRLEVTFPVAGTNLTISTSYWVLATDYTSYSLVYTCSYNPDTETRQVFSWKLSRTKQLPATANTIINNVIADIPVLDQRYYVTRDQSPEACFYVPEPQPGVPVVFPGVCNASIPVAQNFNLTRFAAGTWYEIEAYPKEFQPGQCVRHEYTQSGNSSTFDLVSLSVVDQFLQESNSVVVSENNTAQLTITINANGTALTIPFWILETDYENYALAYSCVNTQVNTNPDFTAIYSWKLSRTQQLSSAANTTINNYISSANIEVLDNSYFETIDQSEDACFYLPELGPGEPVILVGSCNPNISVVQNFDAARYQGLWHLIESYPSAFQNGSCNDATYTIQADGSVLVFNTQVINQTLDTITGSAVLATTDGSARLNVTFPTAPQSLEYWVLDTDYDSYSLVYSCLDLPNNLRQVWSWKLSRTRSLTQNATNAINQVIDTVQVLNNRYYDVINQTDDACFYFPEPNGQPVRFRGYCDETIPVVTNFNAAAYLGVWYDIESYPQVFQEGTCSTAHYGLIDAGVNVFNTQVINQTRDSLIGLAVVDPSDNGEAKLTVTFPIVGTNFTVSTPYWVLATDYNNYALVYSCSNLNVTTDHPIRSVSSWKLSRERTLSAPANTAINNVINSIPVLRQDYFELQGHTDDDCFYYPEPVAGEPVVFPGNCESNIPAVPNFNLTRFSGVWHEIETYPKEQQQGQCINHNFTETSNNSMSLINSQVIGQRLNVILGSANVVSNDSSARLTLSINSNGSVIDIPYWILDTDYDNYALAYSCVNINSTFRGVWSWKLSKQRQLSAAANASIASALSTTDVLDQRYFEPVQQTNESCFYYPELGPTEPVTFIGTCDTNISVVQNFNATAFSGRWFDIESYFDDYQGDCIDSTFTQTGNGFDVRLTQVVNETLDVTLSQAVVANDGSGRLIVTTNGVQYEYWILATDYTDYALIYSCQNINENRRRVRSWKLSKTRQLSTNANTVINNVISNINVLDAQYYNTRNHSDQACFYYPEPVPGQPVLFRGRCSQTIPVVQNFNVTAYLGVWYDMQSYPTEFQNGTCGQANYSLNSAGSVDVVNSQVIAQRQYQNIGIAEVASTDNSARLNVTFFFENNVTASTPYWVLGTDYNSYSLVYSCSEVDDEYMRVTSWKLSRNQTGLSTAANTAINNAINPINVLQQQYYHEMPQSEETCFFYPPLTNGNVILEGQCPQSSNVDVVTNFTANLFSGIWHEISRFPSNLQDGTCAGKELSTNSLTTTIVVGERLITVTAAASVSNDGRGIISTNLTDSNGVAVPLDLYVLATDYSGFALIYSCRNIDNSSKQIFSWELSRSRDGLSPTAITTIDNIVASNEDLFEDYYQDMDQSFSACFYYPEFDVLPSSIELYGPCNETIRGVAGFNATAYLGRWYEIARYPDPQQAGACSRAEYSLSSAGPVNVYNSQVVNQTLQTQLGSAVVASDDGTGLLNVTFVVNGETRYANYYILGTDYNSYALVYSCRNLPNGNRTVSSWKLSRNETLSAQANTSINAIVNSTQGLLEDYYITTGQTDEDCFYIPEVNVTQPVLFRTRCENITGVAGFNLQQYLGWWHEIESYPTGSNRTCTSSQFSGSGNAFQVVDTNVNGLEGVFSTYTVTATNDGRLTRTGPNGQQETWIVLATDYDTYSLVYTCEAVDDEYVRVWSAKHSKSRQLTEAAQTAMASVITQNRLLYQQFYLPVDQSDAACFFYPIADGNPVTLPGQCASDIPVVTNFQIEEYTGRWYQIERYPQQWETGNCTGAQYIINDDEGRVDVINWQVIDGELDTIEGNATAIPSDDNGARFIVELPSRIPGDVNGTVSTELYVLATDYTSYALTYSCYNVNNFERRVAAWKLSRTRSLTASAVAAINQYMAGRQELDQRFFVSVGQDENCQEPNSSFLVKSSVIILLVCSVLQLVL